MRCDPFADATVSGSYFAGADREDLLRSALHMARFATQVVVFTGAPGVGKTKLLAALTASLDGVSAVVRLQGSFMLTVEQVFGQIGDAFDLPAAELAPAELRAQVLQRLRQGVARSKALIVLVDDVHEVPERTLASLLELAHDDSNDIKLLLFAATDGNGDLRPELNRDAIKKIAIRPLDLVGVEDYMRYRVTIAGDNSPFPFTKADLLSLSQLSGGIPEHMHDMAEQKLRAALAGQPQSPPPAPLKVRVPWLHVVAAVGLLLFIVVLWSTGSDDDETMATKPEAQVARTSKNFPPATQTVPAERDKAPRTPQSAPAPQETPARSAAPQKLAAPGAEIAALATKPEAPPAVPKNEAVDGKAAVKPEPQVKIVATEPAAAGRSSAGQPASRSVKVEEQSSTAAFTSDERYLLSLPASHYTLQLVGSKSSDGVRDFANRHKDGKIIVFRQRLNNKPWYVAVTGDYPNREQATTALAGLPKALRELKPWARPLSKVQADIKSAGDVR